MWKGRRVTVAFPAYNEASNIALAVREFLDLETPSHDQLVDAVFVIDNNSIDGTGELARAAGAVVVHESAQGYGHAMQRALRASDGDLIVLAEPDGTFVAEDLYKLLAYADDFEMVCGTRTTPELIWQEANMGWFLRFGNLVVAKLLEVLYDTPSLSDCGCTFRLIRREAAAAIDADLHVGASHFLPNMIVAARMNGVSFIEIPVSYRGRVGQSKITGSLSGTWKTGTAMIDLIVRSWPEYVRRRRAQKA